MVSPCCNKECATLRHFIVVSASHVSPRYWCRHCHNEANSGGPSAAQPGHACHELERKQVTRLQCALCRTVQPLAAECLACGTSFGRYSCLECRLFDDDVGKQQFHCERCGICRVGGRDNYFHCNNCGCCYSKSIQGSHTCVERSMHQDCPVCLEFLFDSIRPITVMHCGHTIHEACLQGLFAHSQLTCPTCLRSVCDMSAAWAQLELEVAQTPMPAEYASLRVALLCNDCGAKGEAPLHVLGMKCTGSCGSFNTQRI
jgi:RING finger/CHY zinc finger protein 1